MNGMTSAVATRDGDRLEAVQQAALAIKPGQLTWDEYQNAALNQLGLKNASNADRAVFLHQCQRTGLDPFARQIMMIERREKQGDNWVSKWTIQTGIEGWRTIRDRAERREGVRGVLSRFTYYDHEDNERKVWTRREMPAAVEVTYTVRDRNGIETPYTSVLRYDEYVQTKNVTQNGVEIAIPIAQWATKGVHMTEKCVEADVYRKTFPQDYAGIELTDAMPPAEHYDEPVQQRRRVTAEQARNRAPRRTTATAEVVSVTAAAAAAPDTTPGDATSAPAAPEATEELTRARNAAHAQAKRVFGDDRPARLMWAARIIRADSDDAVKSFDHLTVAELNEIRDTLNKVTDPAALEKLLTTGETTNA